MEYDAKIFSLTLLLSSYFCMNIMGVIDEPAIDRLHLVTELAKHICVATDSPPPAEADLSVSFRHCTLF